MPESDLVQVPIESLYIVLKQRINADLKDRADRLGIFLIQKIRLGFQEKLKTTRGMGGALGGLLSEIEATAQMLELHLGVSESAKYLANLEYGERGTQGGSGTFTRSKAPPIKDIYEWIRRASLPIPRYYVERGESNAKRTQKSDKPWYSTDPITLYAFDIAQKRKRMGIPALRVIDTVLTQQQTTIEKYLTGTEK